MSIPVIMAVLTALRGLKRTCLRCLEEQIVPKDEKQATVPCKFCGAAIPPLNPQKTYE